MGCSLEDDVTSGPAPACYVRDDDDHDHHHLALQRDQDELMLLCDERVDEDESNDGVVENTSSSASSSRDDVKLSSRQDEAATGGGDNGDDSHSTQALLLNKDLVQPPVDKDERNEQQQQQSLYALRRNPKRSQRFIDEEFALEISAGPTPSGPKSSTGRGPSTFNEKARACTECGKEFSSWKALFGHMRCHPEREWRGIQKPVSIHQLAAKSGLKRISSKSTKSRSQGQTSATISAMSFQEDRAASGLFKVLASDDDESDTESIEAAYMNGGGFFSSKSDSTGPRAMAVAAGKITGKRSKRQRTIFLQQEAVSGDMKEERDMANCLVMLASAGQKSSGGEEQDVSLGSVGPEDEDGEQLAEEMNNSGGELEEEKQNSMMIALRGSPGDGNSNSPIMTLFEGSTATATTSRNLFVEEPGLFGGGDLLEHMKYECATCKRIFKSHQALGGHRASHKKVKGCFARTNSDGVQQQQQAGEEEMTMMVSEELLLRSDEQLDFQDHYNGHHHGHIVPVFVSPTLAATASAAHHRGHLNYTGFKEDTSGNVGYGFNRKQLMKAHECSICHRVFTSGQALGGHKRCHWGGTVDRAGAESQETSAAAAGDNRRSSSSSKLVLHGDAASIVLPQKDELLDLNLPARGQAGEYQVEVEIVARREFQQEAKIVRKPDTESAAAAAAGVCAFEQLPRLVPAYTLVKRKKEAAAAAAKLATKRNSGTALNGLHQLGLGQTTAAASMTTTTTMTTTKRTVQAPASAGQSL